MGWKENLQFLICQFWFFPFSFFLGDVTVIHFTSSLRGIKRTPPPPLLLYASTHALSPTHSLLPILLLATLSTATRYSPRRIYSKSFRLVEFTGLWWYAAVVRWAGSTHTRLWFLQLWTCGISGSRIDYRLCAIAAGIQLCCVGCFIVVLLLYWLRFALGVRFFRSFYVLAGWVVITGLWWLTVVAQWSRLYSKQVA